MTPSLRVDLAHLEVALRYSKLSKDPNTKVGALVVSPDNRTIYYGFNGFPPGIDDWREVLHGEETRMGMVKNDMMVHAEVNCLLNAKEDVTGWTMYTTHTPCHECAKAIAAARIGRVVTLGLGTTSDLGQSRGKLVLNFANIPLEEVQV